MTSARPSIEQARREEERTAQLLANKAISAEEADGRKARYDEARALLDSARLDLEYTKVRAPIDGRVSRALLTEGNYVSGAGRLGVAAHHLVSVDPVYVYADIDENALLKFNELVREKKLGDDNGGAIPVELQLADEQGFPHPATSSPSTTIWIPNTGSILLRAVFPNADGRMVPGLFARIRDSAERAASGIARG